MSKSPRLVMTIPILVIVFIIATAQPTLGAVLLGNSFTPDNGRIVDSTPWQAWEVFDVPAGDDYVLTSVDTMLTGAFGTPNTLNLSVYEDNAGAQGPLLADLGNAVVTEDYFVDVCGAYTFAPAGTVTLTAGARYWLVLSYVSGSGVGAWCFESGVTNVPTGIFTYVGSFHTTGSSVESNSFTINGDLATLPVTVLNVPNTGEIMITSANGQPVYDGPAGSVIRHNGGAELWLPHDYDGNGFDTYIITDTAVVDGRTWYGIFLGNETWGYVPADKVSVTR